MLLALLLCLFCFFASIFAARSFRLFRFRRHVGRRHHPRPPPSACRGQPKPAWVADQVVRLKALMPGAGCRTIAATFNRRFFGRKVSVSKSYVARVLRQRAYEAIALRREIKHRVPAALPVNRVWGLDLTGKQDVRIVSGAPNSYLMFVLRCYV